jgi:hypothetical protein
MLSAKYADRIAGIARQLYAHVLIDNIPDDSPYKRGIRPDRQWFMALDWVGYYELFGEILGAVLEIPGIKDGWSEHSIREEIGKLLDDLATLKTDPSLARSSINYGAVARRWLATLDLDFAIRECYVPIIGLAVINPLEMGEVTFWPLEVKMRDFANIPRPPDLFERLGADTDCIASTKVKAEVRKANEILCLRAENALNILRYVSTLIWQDQPPKQIFVSGREPSISAYAMSVDNKGYVSQLSNSIRDRIPFAIDNTTLQIANIQGGLTELQALSKKAVLSPLEKNLFVAINWFGNAALDLSPLHSFVKFYIAIETLIEKKWENVGNTMPERVSTLSEQHDRKRRNGIKGYVKGLINERNEIFHTGQPKKYPADYLQWLCRDLARNTIRQFQILITSNRVQTMDDLIAWVKETVKGILAKVTKWTFSSTHSPSFLDLRSLLPRFARRFAPSCFRAALTMRSRTQSLSQSGNCFACECFPRAALPSARKLPHGMRRSACSRSRRLGSRSCSSAIPGCSGGLACRRGMRRFVSAARRCLRSGSPMWMVCRKRF